MNPQDTEQYDSSKRVGRSLTVTQPGEHTICEIKRHPIGIIGVYIMSGILLTTVAGLAYAVMPHLSGSDNSKNVALFGGLAFLVLAIICGVFSLISTKVYWGNSWILTSDSITQITQYSLFRTQSAQLSLGNLEDVTVEQNGMLPHMFNYGLLRVETAGERSKFVFPYCPNPNYYAQQVLEAREEFEQGRHGEVEQHQYKAEDSLEQNSSLQ